MKRLITSAMALTLLMGGAASAQDREHKHGGGGKHDNSQAQQPRQGGGGKHDNAGGRPDRSPGGGGRHDNGAVNPNAGRHDNVPNHSRPDNRNPNWDRNRNDNRNPNWDRNRNDNRNPNWNRNRNDNRNPNWNRGRERPRNFDRRAYQRNVWAKRKFRVGVYHRPPGWYYRRWTYGQVLPFAFFANQYWLNNWYYYGLPTPPYGYEWVRYGDDAILVDVRTGMILQVMYGVFY